MADNSFGMFIGGGAGTGIGISNFTMGVAGVILLAGLTAHVFGRQKQIHANRRARHSKQVWEGVPYESKRQQILNYRGHGDPINTEDAMGDLYSYVCSITLPDTAEDNGDRIRESIHRHKPRIKAIMDSITDGQISSEEGHHRLHGMSQYVMDELDLPYRRSMDYMPHAMSGYE